MKTTVPNSQLSQHFTLYDLCDTDHEQFQDQNREYASFRKSELATLATLLERIHALTPISVTSGIRCPDLNAFVGGSQKSQHILGQAADIIPLTGGCERLFQAIQESGIKFHQLIAEPDVSPFNCVHVSVPTGQRDGQVFTLNIQSGRKVWISKGV